MELSSFMYPLAGKEGFEPPITGSEPAGLPLAYFPIEFLIMYFTTPSGNKWPLVVGFLYL